MFLLKKLSSFKLIQTNELKKLINIKSYLRGGKLVKQSKRKVIKVIKKSNNKKTNVNILNTTNTKNKKFFINYFNTEYNNRLSVIHKEEISNWDKLLKNIDIKKMTDITDWDDSVSVLDYIKEDIKNKPNSFRSITHKGKVMAMATVEEDKINKCLKVNNLLSNPERLSNKVVSGAGVTSILHMIEESIGLGYEGKLKLTALPKASKFYEKLGFKRIGNPYNFQYVLEKEAAQTLLDNHFSVHFNRNKLTNFSINTDIQEALELEKNIVAFAISKLN